MISLADYITCMPVPPESPMDETRVRALQPNDRVMLLEDPMLSFTMPQPQTKLLVGAMGTVVDVLYRANVVVVQLDAPHNLRCGVRLDGVRRLVSEELIDDYRKG